MWRLVLAISGVLALAPPLAMATNWSAPSTVTPDDVDVAAASGAITSDGTQLLGLARSRAGARPLLALTAVPKGASGALETRQLSDDPAYGSQIATDQRGAAHVAWLEEGPGGTTVSFARRSADGTISIEELAPGRGASVGANAGGRAAVSWVGSGAGGPVVRTAVRPAGEASSFAVASDLSSEPATPQPAEITTATAVLPGGDVIVVWNDPGGGLRVRVRRVDGSLSGVVKLGQRQARQVQLVSAGNRALAVWTDSANSQQFGGDLLAAIIGPSGPLGEAQIIGAENRDGGTVEPPAVAATADGRVLLAWQRFRATSGGGQGQDTAVLEGDLDSGVLAGPPTVVREVNGGPASQVPAAAALGDDGRAIVSFDGMRTALRRAGAADFDLPQRAACNGGARPLLAALEDEHVLLLWRVPASLAEVRPVFATRSGAAAPLDCPKLPRSPYAEPENPLPGQSVKLDASSLRNTEGARTRWAWDTDGDGTHDLDFDDRPVINLTFTAPGPHFVGVTGQYERPVGTVVGGAGHLVRVYVQTPYAFGPPTSPPALGGTPRPPEPAVTVTPTLRVTSSLRLATLRRSGLAVRVTPARSGAATVIVSRTGRTLARTRHAVKAGRTTTLRVRPRLSPALRRTRRFTLRLKVKLPGTSVLVRTVRVTR